MIALAVEFVSLLLGAAMVVSSLAYMTAPASTSPWLMPLIVGGAIVFVSIILIATELLSRRSLAAVADGEMPADGTDFSQSTGLTVGIWLALSTGYALVTPLIGFEVTTFIFLVIALKLFGRTSWLVIVSAAAGVSLVLPWLFRHLFFTLVP